MWVGCIYERKLDAPSPKTEILEYSIQSKITQDILLMIDNIYEPLYGLEICKIENLNLGLFNWWFFVAIFVDLERAL